MLAVGGQFTVQNPNKLYVLVSSALPTTRRDMTCTVLKANSLRPGYIILCHNCLEVCVS